MTKKELEELIADMPDDAVVMLSPIYNADTNAQDAIYDMEKNRIRITDY